MKTNGNMVALTACLAGLALALRPSLAPAQDEAAAAVAAQEASEPDPDLVRKIREATKVHALRQALGKEDMYLAMELIEEGVDIETTAPPYDRTALMVAADMGLASTVDALIGMGADVGAVSKNGGTALMYAITEEHPEIVVRLIDAGSDLEAKSRNGWTALTLAVRHGRKDLVKLLLDEGVDTDGEMAGEALNRAVGAGRLDIVDLLLEAGVDPGAVDLN